MASTTTPPTPTASEPIPAPTLAPSSLGDSLQTPRLGYWNWGALFLGGIWALGNRVWIGAIVFFVPGSSFILAILGDKLAWEARKWDSFEHFKRVQKTWALTGAVLFLFVMVLGPILFYGLIYNMLSHQTY